MPFVTEDVKKRMNKVFDVSPFLVNFGVFALIPVAVKFTEYLNFYILNPESDYVFGYFIITGILIAYKIYKEDAFFRTYFFDEKMRHIENTLNYDPNNDYSEQDNIFSEVYTQTGKFKSLDRKNEVLDNPENFDPLLVEYYENDTSLKGAFLISLILGIISLKWWYGFILK